jgi:hypothetical protein
MRMIYPMCKEEQNITFAENLSRKSVEPSGGNSDMTYWITSPRESQSSLLSPSL